MGTNCDNLFVDLENHPDIVLEAVNNYHDYVEKMWVGHYENDMLVTEPVHRQVWWNSRTATIETGLRTTCGVEAWHDAYDRRTRTKGRPGVSFTC